MINSNNENQDKLQKVTYQTHGTCSKYICISVDEDGTVRDAEFIGGCNGNTKGVCATSQPVVQTSWLLPFSKWDINLVWRYVQALVLERIVQQNFLGIGSRTVDETEGEVGFLIALERRVVVECLFLQIVQFVTVQGYRLGIVSLVAQAEIINISA